MKNIFFYLFSIYITFQLFRGSWEIGIMVGLFLILVIKWLRQDSYKHR